MTSAGVSCHNQIILFFFFLEKKNQRCNGQSMFLQTIVILRAFKSLQDWLALYAPQYCEVEF